MTLLRRLLCSLLLLLLSTPILAVPQPAVTAEGSVAMRTALVLGVPREGYPPFLYEMPDQRYVGPLRELTVRLAAQMDLPLRYVPYNTYADAQTALSDGSIDALIGVERDALDREGIDHIGQLGSYPRAVLMREPEQELTLARARTLRWVCIRGFGGCHALRQLGISHVTEVESRIEATYMVKLGVADATLGLAPTIDLEMKRVSATLGLAPTIAFEMKRLPATMGVVMPDWLTGGELTIATRADDPVFTEQIWQAYQRIPVAESRLLMEQEDDSVNVSLLFEPDESAWLKQHNRVVRFAVAPHFAGVSEIDESGMLHGYLADLLELLSLRAGIRFALEPTTGWQASLGLLKEHKVDLIPFISPLQERQSFARFTSPYLELPSYVVARRGTPVLKSVAQLRNLSVGGVTDSYEKSLIERFGGKVIEVSEEADLLTLLDSGRVEYVLMSITNLGQQVIKGFNDKYQVVLSAPELSLSIGMGVNKQQPELVGIMDKLLLTVTDEEWQRLERRWLNVSVKVESDYRALYRWLLLGSAVLLLSGLLVTLWARSLQRQIAQRRIAESKLNEQLLFVQTLLNSLPTMVALLDSKQRIVLCNRAYREAFPGAYTGLRLANLQNMPEIVRNRVLEEERRVWQTGLDLEGAGSILQADGTACQVIYVKRAYRDAGGNIQGVLTVLTDVSRLKEAEARARQAETRLTQITNSMPGGVYQYVWQGPGIGHFLYVSQGASEILGVSEQALLGSPLYNHEFGVADADAKRFACAIAHHAQTLTPIDLEVKLARPDGDRYIQVRGNFVREQGAASLINGVIQDITALKRQQHELQEARAAAELAMQARSRFLATMSHELRTPISGMHGMLELLQLTELSDDQRYMTRSVITAANNLLYLVNDILDFSKMEAGQLQLHYQRLALAPVIGEAIRGHAAQAHNKGLQLVLAWGNVVPDQAELDGLRVSQVLANLLSNAVKFTAQGAVTVVVDYHDQQLVITVSDTGIGIDDNKIGRLFTPFEQLESDVTRRFGGTGLGLAICDQLVRKMGGEISMTSQKGQGSCCTFAIPLRNPQWEAPPLAGSEWWLAADNPHLEAALRRWGANVHLVAPDDLLHLTRGLLIVEQAQLVQQFGASWQAWLQQGSLQGGIITAANGALPTRIAGDRWWRVGSAPVYPDLLLESCLALLRPDHRAAQSEQVAPLSGRVLVADDHPINRALLARQLAMLGIDASVVEDGEQALQAWQAQHYDLLLTDCHMPVMDGYALTRTLREQGVTAPIIGVTAYISEQASEQMVATGMSDILFKPYPLDTLRQLVQRWLPQAAMAKAADKGAAVTMRTDHWITLFGDEQTARVMARAYLDANRQDGEALIAALATRDTDALMHSAHRIKGAARMVGQQALAASAASLEAAASGRQLEQLAALSDNVQTLMTAIAHEIGSWLDEQRTA